MGYSEGPPVVYDRLIDSIYVLFTYQIIIIIVERTFPLANSPSA